MLKRKFIIFVSTFGILFSFFVPFARAQSTEPGPWYNQNFDQWVGKVFDPSNPTEIFGERYTFAQVQWIVYSLALLVPEAGTPVDTDVIHCWMTGVGSIAQCTPGLESLENQGDRPSFAQIIMRDRPISGISYVKNLGKKFNLVHDVNAQAASPGTGYRALNTVQGYWTLARNMVYSLFVFFIMIAALMVMFRVKMSPQAVVTVQSIIPKLVVSLILITFSYAIAGFLIDMMYVVMGLIALLKNVYFNLIVSGIPIRLDNGFVIPGIFGMIIGFYTLVFASLIEALRGSFGAMQLVVTFLVLIALIASLFTAFKLILTIVRAVAIILLLTIVAPFQIALGIFSKAGGFGAWMKSYISNLAVFPVIGIMFILAYSFLLAASPFAPEDTPGASYIVPVNTSEIDGFNLGGWPPLLDFAPGVSGNLLFIAVAFVIFASIPKAAEIIKSLSSGRSFLFGTAVGEAVGDVKGTHNAINSTGRRLRGSVDEAIKGRDKARGI